MSLSLLLTPPRLNPAGSLATLSMPTSGTWLFTTGVNKDNDVLLSPLMQDMEGLPQLTPTELSARA